MNAPITTTSAALGMLSVISWAAGADTELLRNPTFEELANLDVTSVTGADRPQFLSPAAAVVLTAEELHNSAARNIPDALRFVPGMQVAQVDSHRWAIASRGFNSITVDKLLVLVDGRSVYTPLWSGVYWEQHEWLDQDVDRVEAIRGPAGSVWGANAVNGVVNILSKHARQTQGVAITVGGGTEQEMFGALRYGGSKGENSWYRAYADYGRHDDSATSEGRAVGDAWNIGRVGFRFDREDTQNTVFLKAEAHSGHFDEAGLIPSATPPFQTGAQDGFNRGGFVQSRWTRRLQDDAEISVGGWYESYKRRLQPTEEETDTLDLGVRYRRTLNRVHDVTSGVMYRRIEHESIPSFVVTLDPAEIGVDQWSAFIQDEVKLSSRLNASVGVRVEDNEFTSPEWQPNVRFGWSITPEQVLWAALGRAVRTPTIADNSRIYVSSVTPPASASSRAIVRQVLGNPDLRSEKVLTYELGWRARWDHRWLAGVSTFYSDYDDLVIFAAGALDRVTLAPDLWRLPIVPFNGGAARSYGAEFSASWHPLQHWQLSGELTYLNLRMVPADNSLAATLTGSSPRLQGSLRSHFELRDDWGIGIALRYVDELPALDVDSFVGLDIRIAKALHGNLEAALSGQNLWRSRHREFRSLLVPVDSSVERGVYFALVWRR